MRSKCKILSVLFILEISFKNMGKYLMRMCTVILLNPVFILGNCLISQHATAYWKESPELDREH